MGEKSSGYRMEWRRSDQREIPRRARVVERGEGVRPTLGIELVNGSTSRRSGTELLV